MYCLYKKADSYHYCEKDKQPISASCENFKLMSTKPKYNMLTV